MKPMIAAASMVTKAQPAVMATRPASAPLMIMVRSGFFWKIHDMMVDEIIANAAAVLVVTAI